MKNEYSIVDGIAYVKISNNQIMICNANDWKKYSDIAWYNVKGYASASYKGKRIYFHRLILNPPSNKEVDHINRNKLDNRRENLRIVSHNANMANRGAMKNSKTKIPGVYWHKHRQKYFVEIKVDKTRICLGAYKTLEEAKKVREQAEKEYQKVFIEKETLH